MGAFGGAFQYLELHPAFADVGMMSWGLMLEERRSGFRCPSSFGWDEDEGGTHHGDY